MQWLVWAAKTFSMQSYTYANAMRPVCSKGATSPIDTHRLCEPIETANTQTITDIKTVPCPNASYGTDPMCNLQWAYVLCHIRSHTRLGMGSRSFARAVHLCTVCICLFRSMSVLVFVCDCNASTAARMGHGRAINWNCAHGGHGNHSQRAASRSERFLLSFHGKTVG